MSVEDKHIFIFGSSTMSLSDTTIRLGGAVDKTKKVVFTDHLVNGTVEVISESASDVAPSQITVWGRQTDGSLSSEVIGFSGVTPRSSTSPLTFERLLRAKVDTSATGGGDHGIVGNTCVRNTDIDHQGTIDYAGTDWAVINATASAVADYYQGMVFRMTDGGAANEIREIVKYDASSVKCYFRDLTAAPSNGDAYEIATGMVFDTTDGAYNIEDIAIKDIRRPFYNIAAEPASGSSVDAYEKVFVWNLHSALALTSATLDEVDVGLYAIVQFALSSSMSGTGGGDSTNDNNDRFTPPADSVSAFSDSALDLGNKSGGADADGNLSASTGQGVWLHLYLSTGASAQNSYYRLQVSGQSI